MQPEEIVKIGEFWSEWSRCHTFKHQRDQLYRFGKLDDCSNQWNDYKKVLQAKFCRDQAEAQRLVESTNLYKERSTSSTAGIIWQLKETPSWDWNDDPEISHEVIDDDGCCCCSSEQTAERREELNGYNKMNGNAILRRILRDFSTEYCIFLF